MIPNVKRLALVSLVFVFLATRLACVWFADHPKEYEHRGSIIGDVTLYQYWGERVVDHSLVPYRDVRIEYPPGSLPFIVGPALVPRSAYRPTFIAIMLLVDAAGLIGLFRLVGRSGSMLGPWLWVLLLPLLGPVAYLRFDLVPAVATIWALERVSRRRWTGAGAWLGFGIVAKLYPAVLLPPLAFSPRRKPIARGVAIVLIVALIPFAAWATALTRSVLRYHLDRGIEIESVWGALMLLWSKVGLGVRMDFSFESLNVVSSVSSELKIVAAVAILAGLAGATWAAARVAPALRDDALPDVMFATLAIVVSLATVLSPQYILWLVAPGAAAVCSPRSVVRGPVLLLAPVAVLTQAIYPFLFVRLASVDGVALATLVSRDLLLVALASWALVALARSGRSDERRHESLPPPLRSSDVSSRP